MATFTELPGEIRNRIYDEVLSFRDATIHLNSLPDRHGGSSALAGQAGQSVVFQVTFTLQTPIYDTGPHLSTRDSNERKSVPIIPEVALPFIDEIEPETPVIKQLKFKLRVTNSESLLFEIDPILHKAQRLSVLNVSQEIRREALGRIHVPILSRNTITLGESSRLSPFLNCLPPFVSTIISSMSLRFHLLTPSGPTGPKWYAHKVRSFTQMAANIKSLRRLRHLRINLGIDDCKSQDVVKPLLEKTLCYDASRSPKIEVKLVSCTKCRFAHGQLHFGERNWCSWRIENVTNEWTVLEEKAASQKTV